MNIDLLPNVRDMLPHREPFLFIDRITTAEPPARLEAEVRLRPDSDFYRGHFPGNPVTPGVILLEAMTQVMVLLSILASPPSDRFRYLFAGADRFRITGGVAPGDLVTLRADSVVHKGRLVRGEASAWLDGRSVASAELTFLRDPAKGSAG